MLGAKPGEEMSDPQGFYRTYPGPDEPYEVYQFDGKRVRLKLVTPNATLSGSPKIDEIDEWEPANFLVSKVNPKAKSALQKLWNDKNAPLS
jgi:hypothetical protein